MPFAKCPSFREGTPLVWGPNLRQSIASVSARLLRVNRRDGLEALACLGVASQVGFAKSVKPPAEPLRLRQLCSVSVAAVVLFTRQARWVSDFGLPVP